MTENLENINKEDLDRAEVRQMLFDSIKIMSNRVTAERVRKQEGDETRLKYARALAQLATPFLAAVRDSQLDEIYKRLEELESERK